MNKIKKLSFALGMLALMTILIEHFVHVLTTSGNNSVVDSTVRVDGSSTVYPITKAIANKFLDYSNKAQVIVNISGTTGGFKKFCNAETDISDASRPILLEEMRACKNFGVQYIELPVAFDGLSVVVNYNNTWAYDITVAELKKMWEPEAENKIKSWKQIRSSWPDRPLKLYGAGKNSGTFDYFTEAIVGKTRASRKDYRASEDDNVIANKVIENPNSLGYFGLAYYVSYGHLAHKLRSLAVDNGSGAVFPSYETVQQNKYQPLSRPLFIYVNTESVRTKPAVKDFIDFYLKQAPTVVKTIGYVPLPEEAYRLAETHFKNGRVGTVFQGEAQLNLTIEDVLQKQAKY